jgi:phage terminase Nu1 subunit (DNA packaging protein)
MEDPNTAGSIDAGIAAVALVAADKCAAIGDVSVSWWHEAVRRGDAPKPDIQQPRFTRWRLAKVTRFWADRVVQAAAEGEARERITARAKQASIKAREPAAVAKAQATKKARMAARIGVPA